MSIITDSIEGYAEMTAEEKLAALESYEAPQPDDTESKRWKAQFDKTAHELAENKKAFKALQEQMKSKMTEDEIAKAESERASREREEHYAQLEREIKVSKMANEYLALGYTQELAESTANALYDNDFDTVRANTQAFKDGLEQTIRANVVKGNPTPTSKGGNGTLTKADIMKIKDRNARQKAIQENIDLFS